jgi:hypothetical protein
MATDDFALPASSWTEQKKMILAYFLSDKRSGGEPLSVPEVAQAAGMDRTLLSRNNKFFHGVGLIEGGQKKTVTPLCRDLGLAISHEDVQEIQRRLATLVHESDFLTRIVSAVKVRSGMDSESLERHIAITAGAAKSKRTMTGTRAVVDLLVESGAIATDETGIFRASDVYADADAMQESTQQPDDIRAPSVASRVVQSESRAAVPPAVGARQEVTINVTINLSADALPEAEDFLREMLGLPARGDSDGSAEDVG